MENFLWLQEKRTITFPRFISIANVLRLRNIFIVLRREMTFFFFVDQEPP